MTVCVRVSTWGPYIERFGMSVRYNEFAESLRVLDADSRVRKVIERWYAAEFPVLKEVDVKLLNQKSSWSKHLFHRGGGVSEVFQCDNPESKMVELFAKVMSTRLLMLSKGRPPLIPCSNCMELFNPSLLGPLPSMCANHSREEHRAAKKTKESKERKGLSK